MTNRMAANRVLFLFLLCLALQLKCSGCGDSLEDALDDIDKRDLTDLTPTIEWGEVEPTDAGCEHDAGDAGCGADAGGD